MAKKYSQSSLLDPKDLVLVFKGINVNVDCNPAEFTEDECKNINQIVNLMSQSIMIDYSYVDYKQTKYNKTFIIEDGWNKLCKSLCITDFSRSCSARDKMMLNEAYSALVIQYLYQCLEDYGYEIENICLEVPEKQQFSVEFQQMHVHDNYPGRWQSW